MRNINLDFEKEKNALGCFKINNAKKIYLLEIYNRKNIYYI